MLVDLFRSRPSLAVELLGDAFDYAVPDHVRVQLSSNDLNDYKPTEYRADAVITATDPAGNPVLAVIVEAQLQPDPDKEWTWLAYLGNLRARLGCPVVLLVVSPTAATAIKCVAPIETGHPGLVLRPLVVGPAQLAPITELDQARHHPERAALAALAHRDHPAFDQIFRTLVAALNDIDHEHAGLYTDTVLAQLPPRARQRWEAFMTRTYEYQSNYARRYFSQGEARGEARAVLGFLRARGIPVPDDAQARIIDCTDLDQLDTWVNRAATATTIHDVLD